MIDVYGYLQKMRKARQHLMETLDQYKFVYDTLEEYAVCGSTYFPVTEISARIKQKSVKNPFTKLNDYQHEYEIICKQAPKFSIGDCAGGEQSKFFCRGISRANNIVYHLHQATGSTTERRIAMCSASHLTTSVPI